MARLRKDWGGFVGAVGRMARAAESVACRRPSGRSFAGDGACRRCRSPSPRGCDVSKQRLHFAVFGVQTAQPRSPSAGRGRVTRDSSCCIAGVDSASRGGARTATSASAERCTCDIASTTNKTTHLPGLRANEHATWQTALIRAAASCGARIRIHQAMERRPGRIRAAMRSLRALAFPLWRDPRTFQGRALLVRRGKL